MLTRTEGADAKRKLHQQTVEVPVPGWHLSASPTLDVPVEHLGMPRTLQEIDKTPGVAKLLDSAETVAFSCWALQLVGSDCPAYPVFSPGAHCVAIH